VVRGDVFVSPDVSAALDARSPGRIDDAIRALSTREFEIARLLVNGLSVREIAERLCLTHKTVANYQTAIRRKLAATTPMDLQQIASRRGLLMPSRNRLRQQHAQDEGEQQRLRDPSRDGSLSRTARIPDTKDAD